MCIAFAVAMFDLGDVNHLVAGVEPEFMAAMPKIQMVAEEQPAMGLTGGTSTGRSSLPGEVTPPFTFSVGRAVGQMLMSHVTGLRASARLLARIRAGQVGSVILYSENVASSGQLARLVASLQQAARAGGNPPLLIGVDQEGGPVKRLPDGPPTISAQQMGASANPSAVAWRQGHNTGAYLHRLGVNLDFAPVADIPTTANNFLRERAFGHTQSTVTASASGFAAGLASAHVAGAAKHFPGLGAAGPRDTDVEIVSITASKSAIQASYKPYAEMARLGSEIAPLVMVSDAIYPTLDSRGLPAVLSAKIVHDELHRVGMGGRVVITDDMEVPSVMQHANAPVLAVTAGDDILMFARRESGSERAYRAITSAARAGVLSRASITVAAKRVIALKRSLGLMTPPAAGD
jgi:beta-N-acetylhexosaminidase